MVVKGNSLYLLYWDEFFTVLAVSSVLSFYSSLVPEGIEGILHLGCYGPPCSTSVACSYQFNCAHSYSYVMSCIWHLLCLRNNEFLDGAAVKPLNCLSMWLH